MDGCSSLQILRRVFLPLVLPGIVTVALFAFITSWNEFIAALIFMSKETSFTVPVMLTGVRTGNFGTVDWGALQAGVIVSIVPCLLIYLLLQRYYVVGPAQRRGEVDGRDRRGARARPSARARPRDDPRRRRRGRCQHRHGVEGAQQLRHASAPRPAPASSSVAGELGFRPNDLAQACIAARASPSG